MYSRYLCIGVFIALVFVIAFFEKGISWKEKLKKYGTMFLEGMVGGFIVDCVGINAGYYDFPRQAFMSFEYFTIVIPCWGLFGMLINCLWNWLGKEKFIRGMLVTYIPLFIWYEGTNLITGSWVYHAPLWSIIVGWMPLIIVFSGCNRRRRVVHKIEEWRTSLNSDNPTEQILRGILTLARIIVTLLMFPLLLAVLVKLLIDLKFLITRKASIWNYTKCLLAMQE
jgi:hypothetical protein